MAHFRSRWDDTGLLMVRKFGKQWSVRQLMLRGRLTDKRFRRYWKSYLFQCALCMVALLAILLVVDVVLRAAIVMAIASTAFIVFIAPHSQASSPRRVIGGHVVAVVVGGVLSLVYLVPEWGELVTTSNLVRDLIAVLSVGLSALLMVLTDTEHPPAAGTALGLGGRGLSPVVYRVRPGRGANPVNYPFASSPAP